MTGVADGRPRPARVRPLAPPAFSQPCQNWPRRPGAAVVTTCRRPYCPCHLAGAKEPGVSHGLGERRFQAEQLILRLPRRAGFVTSIVHARGPLAPTEVTGVWQAVKRVLTAVDPTAVVWAVTHFTADKGGVHPHLHVAVFTDTPDRLLARKEELAGRITRAAQAAITRHRAKVPGTVLVTTSHLDVRIEVAELRDGLAPGPPERWLRYVLKTTVAADQSLVRPPAGEGFRLLYGVTRARRVATGPRRSSLHSRLVDHDTPDAGSGGPPGAGGRTSDTPRPVLPNSFTGEPAIPSDGGADRLALVTPPAVDPLLDPPTDTGRGAADLSAPSRPASRPRKCCPAGAVRPSAAISAENPCGPWATVRLDANRPCTRPEWPEPADPHPPPTSARTVRDRSAERRRTRRGPGDRPSDPTTQAGESP